MKLSCWSLIQSLAKQTILVNQYVINVSFLASHWNAIAEIMAASVDHYYMGQALRDRWNLKHVFTEPALGWQLDYSVAVLTSHPLSSAGRAAATIAFGAHEIEILRTDCTCLFSGRHRQYKFPFLLPSAHVFNTSWNNQSSVNLSLDIHAVLSHNTPLTCQSCPRLHFLPVAFRENVIMKKMSRGISTLFQQNSGNNMSQTSSALTAVMVALPLILCKSYCHYSSQLFKSANVKLVSKQVTHANRSALNVGITAVVEDDSERVWLLLGWMAFFLPLSPSAGFVGLGAARDSCVRSLL